jgi:hypothetical protein
MGVRIYLLKAAISKANNPSCCAPTCCGCGQCAQFKGYLSLWCKAGSHHWQKSVTNGCDAGQKPAKSKAFFPCAPPLLLLLWRVPLAKKKKSAKGKHEKDTKTKNQLPPVLRVTSK